MTKEFKGRREDQRLIIGRGRYTSDWRMPDQLYASFRRADRAHARIRSIDKTEAEASPGVVAVFTHADLTEAGFRNLPPSVHFPGRGGFKIIVPDRPILAHDRVRFVGEEVAVVVAETAHAAADAAELIEIDYEDLPVVIGFDNALADGFQTVHDEIPNNVCFDFEYGDEAKTAAVIAGADHVVQLTLESPRVAPTPMEPRGALAWYDSEKDFYEIRCPNQGGPGMRDALAVMLGVPANKIRVHMVDVGGAFGARTAPYPEYPLLMHVAKALGRPVKWLSTRSEDFLTDNHGRAIRLSGELAFDKSGKFLALRTSWLCDSGAYLTPAGALTNSTNGLSMGAGVYLVETLYGRHRQVMTNTAPTNAYRGAGRPEAAFIVERLVDEAAIKLGMDPLELRRRNVIPREAMPYKTLTGSVFDSGDFVGLIEKVEKESDWHGFAARKAEAAKRGKILGIGCAVFLEPSGGGAAPKDQVAILFDGGKIVIHNVAGPSGQSHETVFTEMVGGWLGIDPESITLHSGDPDGPSLAGSPAIGSRSILTQGSAYKIASEEVVRKGLALAADILEASTDDVEFRSGSFIVRGTDHAVTLTDVVERHADTVPHPLSTIGEIPIARAFPSGAHVAEVEIDAETGSIKVISYVAVDDIGTVINHVFAAGQIHGGVVQGAGQVFGEQCLYDEEGGQLLSGSFMDYVMPRADLFSDIRTVDHAVPSPTNLLGAKGAGEGGSVGALPTCTNAIADALRSVGVTQFDMPATPWRLWEAMNQAAAAE